MMNVAADDFFTFQVRRRQPFTVFAFTVFMCAATGRQPPRRGPTHTHTYTVCMDSVYLATIYVCRSGTSDFHLL